MIVDTNIQQRVYNPDLVLTHSINDDFKKQFSEILYKDYEENSYGFSQEVLNMICIDHDEWEKSSSGSNDKTMDCSTAVASFDDVRRIYSNHRHLLIELKLKCKSHTLDKSDYTGKIKHSRDLLFGSRLHSAYIFIFIDSVQRKAKSNLAQWSRGSNGSIFKMIVPITPTDFNSFIGFEHQFPYTPINKREAIVDSLKTTLGNADAIYAAISYWKDKVIAYMGTYQLQEVSHICETISSLYESLVGSLEDEIDKQFIILELEEFKKHIA